MDNLELFHNLINLAAADGKFASEEIRFLAARAEQWNIADDEFESALAGLSEGNLELNIPESDEDRVQLMKEMLKLMAVDGELADMEKRLCAEASAKMDFTSNRFEEILDAVLRGE